MKKIYINKTFYYLFLILLILIPLLIFAENVPAAGSSDFIVSPTDITIGSDLETMITYTFLNAFSAKMPGISGIIDVTRNLFIGLFLLDYMYCLSSAYAQNNYNALIPTTVLKGFFAIAVYTALSPDGSGAFVTEIIKEIVEKAAKINGFGVRWNWFSPSQAQTAIREVNNQGVLSQLDKIVSKVSNSLLNNSHFWSSGAWLIWLVFIFMAFRFLYFQMMKLMAGLLIKSFEWSIGIPAAFLMLAGKGHPQGEEYFNTGMKYLYHVALDFAILMGMFALGVQMVDGIIQTFGTGGIGATAMALLQLLFCFTFWTIALFNVETIVAGIAGGAPKFSAAMGSALLAIGNSILGSSGLASPINAIKGGVNNKMNGGSFFGGVGTTIKESVIGKSKVGEDGRRKWDFKDSALGQMGGNFTHDLNAGYTSQNEKMEVIDPITGMKTTKTVEVTGLSQSKSGKMVSDTFNFIETKKNEHLDLKDFEKEKGISKQDMRRMGLKTKQSRELFMKHHDKFEETHQEMAKYGGAGYGVNAKTGHKAVINANESAQVLKELKHEANNQLNSVAQRNYSAQSDMTKSFKKILSQSAGSPDAQIKALNNWIKDGQGNMSEFNLHEFREATKNIAQTLIKNKDTKGLIKLQKSLGNNLDNVCEKAEKNSLFEHIEDSGHREGSNKAMKVHLNYINNHIKGLSIK